MELAGLSSLLVRVVLVSLKATLKLPKPAFLVGVPRHSKLGFITL